MHWPFAAPQAGARAPGGSDETFARFIRNGAPKQMAIGGFNRKSHGPGYAAIGWLIFDKPFGLDRR